ncbi:Demethylepipodophyllotoxin synthase [Linum perenne]
MDLLITSLSATSPSTIILTLVASLIIFYVLFRPSPVGNTSLNPPPQADGAWPIIGHLHLLGGPRPPHIVLGQMADKFGPIFTIRMGVHPAVVVSNWEMAKECLTTHDRVFADRPATIAMDLLGYQRSMFGFSPYGPYWRETRKIATLELLSSHRLQLLRHVREAEVSVAIKELYGYWCSNERNGVVTVEMDSWFGDIALNVILKMIVGKSIGYLTAGEDGVRLKKLLKSFFELSGRFVVADGVPYLRWMDVGGFEKEMRKTAEEMDVVIVGWLKEHKDKRDSGGGVKAAEDDFMDVILNLLGDEGAIMDRDSDTVNKATSLVKKKKKKKKMDYLTDQIKKSRFENREMD